MATTESIPTTLNKMSLAERLSDRTGLGRAVAYEAVECMFDIVAVTVASGGTISITNFGSLERVDRTSRRARNPHTGEAIQVPARKAVKWNPSPRLTEFANSANPADATIRKTGKGPIDK